MSFTNGPVFTSAGKTLHARAIAGEPLTFTKLELGDGSLGSVAIWGLTALRNSIASVGISSLRHSGNVVVVRGTFSNAEITNGFYWREIGLFAADPDNPNDRSKDILYCYQNAGSLADYIPASGSELITKRISLAAIVEDVATVNATFSAAVAAEDVSFDDTNANLDAENVQEALDALANKSDIAISDTEPTDANAELWLDTSDDGETYIHTGNQYLLDELAPATVEA